MKRILAGVLAVVLLAVIVSPALGGPSITSINKTAKKALKTAKQARSSAGNANRELSSIDNDVAGAVATAGAANTKADQALARPVVTPGGITTITGTRITSFPDAATSAIAICPAGQRVISGGGFFNDGGIDGLVASSPTTDRTAWFVLGYNNAGITGYIEAYALCVPGGAAVAAGNSHARTRAEVRQALKKVEARASHSCSAGYTHASLSWGHKCLRAGQFCKRGSNSEYHRYGYHCKSNGHLRRW